MKGSMLLSSISDALPHAKLLVMLSLNSLLDLCLLAFATYLIIKIYKLIKFTDIPMFLSIISIAMALLCLFIFCLMDIISFYQEEESFLNTPFGINIAEQVDSLKVMFIYCAFVFDLYKWCLFLIATGTTVNIKCGLLQARQKYLRIGLIALQSLIVIVSLIFVTAIIVTSPANHKEPSELNDQLQDGQFIFISSSFGAFLVIYSIVLYLLLTRLKRYFPGFYTKEKKQILFASVSVIVSIIARMGINIVYSNDEVNEALNISFRDDTWLFPVSQFVSLFMASIFPIASIIYSLMYAITHKKRLIKKSKATSLVNRHLLNRTDRCQSIHSLLADNSGDDEIRQLEEDGEEQSDGGASMQYQDRPYMMGVSGHNSNLMTTSKQLAAAVRHQHDEDSQPSASLLSSNNNIAGLPNEPTSLSPLHQLKMKQRNDSAA